MGLTYSSVDGSKVINASLSGPDIANGGLSGADLADGSVKAADLGLVTVQEVSGSDPPMSKTVSATCPSGKQAIGGGGNILASEPGAHPENRISLVPSRPAGTSWIVRAEVIKHPVRSVKAWAVCV